MIQSDVAGKWYVYSNI